MVQVPILYSSFIGFNITVFITTSSQFMEVFIFKYCKTNVYVGRQVKGEPPCPGYAFVPLASHGAQGHRL